MIEKRKIEVPDYIDSRRPVSVKVMGNIKQINISDRLNKGATVLPISKEEYMVKSTGEIKQVTHHARDRTQNLRNLEKSMKNLRDLINANVTPCNIKKVRFITLTYKENMRDKEKLYTDFKNFNKRFKRYIEKINDITYEYIVCVEAQGRGAFHLHMIAIFSKAPPFIDSAELAQIWGYGFVSIKALNGNIDNIGVYLTAYLSDLDIEGGAPLTPELLEGDIEEVITEEGKCKHVIKGARLKLLPVGINIYRCSRGIKRPQIIRMSYEDAQKEMADTGYKKVYESAIKISDTDSEFTSTYICMTFKKHINPDFRWNGSEQNKNKE